jgi:hypothetical protein
MVARSGKTAAGDGPARVAPGHTAYCGASREPIYRTLNEASESGLEVCDTCLADSRRSRQPSR